MKIVWLIQNLVPYHHARFEAFSSAFDGAAHLIQVTGRNAFRVLEFETEKRSYSLHTLFENADSAKIPLHSLQSTLSKTLAEIQPDCVCVSGWGMRIGQMLQLWALKHRIPVVIFSESTSYDESRVWWKEWTKSTIVRDASAALVGGTAHKNYIVELGIKPETVFLGHNAVDNQHFSQPVSAAPDGIATELESVPFFFACARFEKKKNLPRLVGAYAGYVNKCSFENKIPWRLVIAGEGDLREETEAVIKKKGLVDQVLLPGAVSYNVLPWFYQNCQAFIHASTTEQWGLVVNEAMAAGAPILLSTRCGCAPDLLQDGGNGFLFDPYDESDIADVLWKFYSLPNDSRRDFGRRSGEIIAEWGPERFAAGLQRAVDKAMKCGSKNRTLLARGLLCLLLWRRRT